MRWLTALAVLYVVAGCASAAFDADGNEPIKQCLVRLQGTTEHGDAVILQRCRVPQ